MLLEIFLCLATFYLFYILFGRRPKGLPPGEWGWPLIGYVPPSDEPPMKFLKKLQEKHGNIFTVKLGQRIVVYIADYPTIKSTFGRQEFSNRPDMYTLQVFRRFINSGVAFANGLKWQTNRRFTIRVLRDFGLGKSSLATTVEVEVKHLIDEMMKIVDKPAKMDWCLNVCIINVIFGITADKRYKMDDPIAKRYVKFITEAFIDSGGPLQILNFYPFLIWALPDFIKNKYLNLAELHRRTDEFLDYLLGIVKDHEKSLDKDNPKDFIDMYLIEHKEQKGKPGSTYVDDDFFDLVSVLADLYVAGSETTSSTIRWYCYYMATHPEIQKKIQQEIDSVVPSDRLPEYEDKERLPYFEASIHELHRIVSLTPMGLPHSATIDTSLNEFTIPKGTTIMCLAELCHRNPKYWKNPDEFYPEHFLDEKGQFYLPKEGFLPFLLGRRQCLGESVAKMELVLFLSAILQTFEICQPEGQPIVLKCDPIAQQTMNLPRSQQLVFKKRNKDYVR